MTYANMSLHSDQKKLSLFQAGEFRVGWVLTSRYNATELDVATERDTAAVEIARVNAAMRYMELVRNLSDEAASLAVVVGWTLAQVVFWNLRIA